MTIFGIDAASFQGQVNWAEVDAICAFGWEKVTESTGYANPQWPAAKAAMLARAEATGFSPGCYLFLHEGNGAGQADWFASQAGDLAGFGLAMDVEPSGASRPDHATALACVARLRLHYPRKPVGGYLPHWYWDATDTTLTDWLWASAYVPGTGSPATLYARLPASAWAPYGGRVPALHQFTSSAVVPGVGGLVDCSAYPGSPAGYAALTRGAVPVAPPAPAAPTTGWQAIMMRALPELAQGSSSADVRRVQALLGAAGYGLSLDGDFGPATETAVRRVQAAHSLSADGIIGPKTWGLLITGAA